MASSQMSVPSLPAELWLEILDYLPPFQLWRNCRRISRTLHFCVEKIFTSHILPQRTKINYCVPKPSAPLKCSRLPMSFANFSSSDRDTVNFTHRPGMRTRLDKEAAALRIYIVMHTSGDLSRVTLSAKDKGGIDTTRLVLDNEEVDVLGISEREDPLTVECRWRRALRLLFSEEQD